jgi:sulfate transport system substrate-binding protein
MKRLSLVLIFALTALLPAVADDIRLTHVSFDISREVVKALGDGFSADWAAKHPGSTVQFEASHAGSSKQAQSVVGGLPADVVTMNQYIDIDYIAAQSKGGLVSADWQKLLPHNASPFSSTMVFVVRSGNPKKIQEWSDLAQPGLNIVVPNLKTTGNGRYTWLTALAWARNQPGATDAKVAAYLKTFLNNVPVQANGGRDATNLFDQRQQGDVLITFEAEGLQLQKNNPGKYLTVVPSYGLVTDIYAATIKQPGRSAQAEAVIGEFWKFVYSSAGQELAAKNFFRPIDASVAAKYKSTLVDLKLDTVDHAFGGWQKVEKDIFAPGALYDQILKGHL